MENNFGGSISPKLMTDEDTIVNTAGIPSDTMIVKVMYSRIPAKKLYATPYPPPFELH